MIIKIISEVCYRKKRHSRQLIKENGILIAENENDIKEISVSEGW